MTTEQHTIYALARLADCADPDSEASPGAYFLSNVADTVAEVLENAIDGGYRQDAISEAADALVPTYTAEVWRTFTDLAAWQEDVTDLCGDDTDMTQRAKVALYMIAERLLTALCEEADENDNDNADGKES